MQRLIGQIGRRGRGSGIGGPVMLPGNRVRRTRSSAPWRKSATGLEGKPESQLAVESKCRDHRAHHGRHPGEAHRRRAAGPRPDRAARDCPTERALTVCAGGTEAAETAAGAGLGSTLSRSARKSDLAGRRSPSRPSVDGRVAAAAGCVAPPEVLLGDFSAPLIGWRELSSCCRPIRSTPTNRPMRSGRHSLRFRPLEAPRDNPSTTAAALTRTPDLVTDMKLPRPNPS